MSDSIPYVIRPGDYLTRLAATRGFDAKKVWEDPKNADLRRRRRNPEVLAAGDIVYIPAREPKRQPLSIGATNAFTTNLPRITVKLVLTGPDGEARANAKYWVDGEPGGSTDGVGRVEIQVVGTRPSIALRVEGCG